MQDHYEVLEVRRDASIEDITRSYKKLALQCHPDMVHRNIRRQNPEVSQETIQSATLAGTERFKAISCAYAILSDPGKRAQYDSCASSQDFQCSERTDQWKGFDTFFENFPIGAHIDQQSFQDMLDKIHQELDQIIKKAQTNSSYQKVAVVLTELKQELRAADPQNNHLIPQNTTHSANIIPSIKVYEFLIDAQIAIQRAKAHQEPGTHRGLLLGTPILRELTLLGLAVFRFIIFVVGKYKRWVEHNPNPVFQQGMCHGLFQPPKTRTLYQLDSFKKEMSHHETFIRISIDGLTDVGKSHSNLCFNSKTEADYLCEEILHLSM